MAAFDFVVTSKYHGIVFSHLLGKPVIALSYHRKMNFAMQAVGQDRFCLDAERFEVDPLIKSFRSLVEERENLKSQSAAAVKNFAAKLSTQFDGLFISDNFRVRADSCILGPP